MERVGTSVHTLRAAEYPRPDYVLLRISDLIGGDGSLYGAVDADGRLGELLDQRRRHQPPSIRP
jgi:3',5'-cyclic-AMP phosphodiesterase